MKRLYSKKLSQQKKMLAAMRLGIVDGRVWVLVKAVVTKHVVTTVQVIVQ